MSCLYQLCHEYDNILYITQKKKKKQNVGISDFQVSECT